MGDGEGDVARNPARFASGPAETGCKFMGSVRLSNAVHKFKDFFVDLMATY